MSHVHEAASPIRLGAILQKSVSTVKANVPAIVVIQGAAAVLVLSYFNSEAVRNASRFIAEFKAGQGLGFVFLTGVVAGSVIPEIVKAAVRIKPEPGANRWMSFAWPATVYGLLAVLVDLLYRLQAFMFGTEATPGVVASKILVDMLVFSTLVSMPFCVGLLTWWRRGFARTFWRGAFSRKFYATEIVSSLPLCWAYWMPTLVMVYSLPLDLQFPFAMLMQSAFSILLVFFVSHEST